MLPSGPLAIENGKVRPLPNSVMTPLVVIRPIFPPPPSVNQRFPSAPTMISFGEEFSVGIGKLVRFRLGSSSRQILFAISSVNQMLPSGPAVIPIGKLKVGVRNSVITPCGVIRATWLWFCSVNQKLPSGPRVIEIGWLSEDGIGKDRCCGELGGKP